MWMRIADTNDPKDPDQEWMGDERLGKRRAYVEAEDADSYDEWESADLTVTAESTRNLSTAEDMHTKVPVNGR
jgi:hypothetical protein